ncbi:MAG TPA: uracil-DNA glycosylase family protein [Solirubrobacterales bacterium]|nr:uracil-DNA glycosylase family protein [Solirubrobacterales bacterium]
MTTPQFDKGPPAELARHFAEVPDPPDKGDFWFDWGPIFYRGRLDGSARVLCIASDPGPTERIAGRSLVGNAGQRVQGFLAKLGLTRSYVCLNAWAYALHPSAAGDQRKKLNDPYQLKWRTHLYDLATGPKLEAIVAFGGMAQDALSLWRNAPIATECQIPHPSSRNEKTLLDEWRQAVVDLRAVVTPDSDGDNTAPNYGAKFGEADYARIPAADLPFGAPSFLGDDAWVRSSGHGQNSVERPSPDDGHTLLWHAPKT